MAYKWVDETKLNAALTASADAIREKTGDTAQINFDMENETGFESAIEEIESGGSTLTLHTFDPMSGGEYSGPDNLDISFETNAVNRYTRNVSGFRKITIRLPEYNGKQYTMQQAFYSSPSDETLEEIVIVGDTSGATNYEYTFSGRSSLKRIDGSLDFSSSTNNGACFNNVQMLEEIDIVPETISIATNVQGNIAMFTDTLEHLTEASFVSIANGLVTQAQGTTKTCKFVSFNIYKDIMGVVSNNLFVIDPFGTVKISDFISEKGWTITT